MWRDRTNLFISYRQSYAHHPAKKPQYAGAANGFSSGAAPGRVEAEERQGLMSGRAYADDDEGGDAVIEMDVLPPRWADVQDEVADVLKTIAQKSAELDRLHQKHVLPGFDDERVKREEEAAIERLTQDITRAFHTCQRAIHRIEGMVREARNAGRLGRGDDTMARNIQISLAQKVQDASASFRKKQSSYLKKLRQLGGLPAEIAGGASGMASPAVQNPYLDPSMAESETDKSFSQSTLQQSKQLRLNSNDTAIAQREREINDIAKGIIELADIFKNLQTMVIDQGTMLDRIDYNVERMNSDVKEAEKELVVATGYQKKTTKRKIIFLLILIITGLILALIFKPRRSGDGTEKSNDPLPP